MDSDPPEISVLCVDDEPGMAELIKTFLEGANEGLTVTTATTATEAMAEYDVGTFDCIVSDYDMPEVDGLAFLDLVRADHPDLPFVLFTGRGSEEIASEAISAGVTDYMQKTLGTDQYQVLARRLRNAVARRHFRKDAAAARERAEIILEASPNAVLVSVEGRCVYLNPAAERMLDPLSAPEILETPISELLQHEQDTLEPVRNGERKFECERFTLGIDREAAVEGAARRIRWDDEPAVVYVLTDVTERAEYEAEVAYRKTLLEATFEASPDGILVTDTDREILTYNDEFATVWGLSSDILETEDAALALGAVEELVAEPEAFRETVEQRYEDPETRAHDEIRLRDGRLLDLHSAPARAEDGELLGIVWFYRDITGVERIEREQREAFDRMTDAVYAVNEDWKFTFLNEQAGKLLERDPDGLLGTNIWNEFPDAAGTELHDQLHSAVETGEPTTFDFHYPPLHAKFVVRAFPSETGVTVYFRDVTSQRRTQAELESAVETLHQLYEVASDPERSFEAKQEELLDIGCSYLGLPQGFVTELTETTQTIVASTGDNELLQPGNSCPLGESYCRKTILAESGLLSVHNASAEGWADDPAYERYDLETYIGGKVVVDGELYGTVCFAAEESREREFTEMERTFVELLSRWLGYELEHREHRATLEAKNDQLEEFASIVSHDLRNPLSVAEGYLEIVKQEHDSDAVEKVAGAHTRMNELIEDILTLSREGEIVGERTQVALATVSQNGWDHVETGEATLEVETESHILADESRVRQLLENLFRNSVEHGTIDGNPIIVRVGDLPDGFYVEDTGAGIDPELREQLFQPGVSSKDDGTGIGLRVVRKIVAAHGWTVEVAESPEGGARFEITGIEPE